MKPLLLLCLLMGGCDVSEPARSSNIGIGTINRIGTITIKEVDTKCRQCGKDDFYIRANGNCYCIKPTPENIEELK